MSWLKRKGKYHLNIWPPNTGSFLKQQCPSAEETFRSQQFSFCQLMIRSLGKRPTIRLRFVATFASRSMSPWRIFVAVFKSNTILIGQPWTSYKIFYARFRYPYCMTKAFLKGFHDVVEWAASVSIYHFQSFSSNKLREIFNTLGISTQITKEGEIHWIPIKSCRLHSTVHLSLPHRCHRITCGLVATSSPLWLLDTRYSKGLGWLYTVWGLRGIRLCHWEGRLWLSFHAVPRLQNSWHWGDWLFCSVEMRSPCR